MTSEVLQASYKLVEKPVEEKPLTAAQEQQKGVRAQAVVQGITPMQPAPMKAEAAKPSIFGKFFGWIKSFAEEEQPKAKPAAGRPRSAQRPQRGERPEGGGKRRDRGGRGERSENAGNRDRNEPRGKPAQAEVAAKPPEIREPRPPKQPRPPRLSEEMPALESQVVAAAGEQAGAGSPSASRRRGRRGGRREREHREIAAQNAVAVSANGEAVQQSFEQMSTAPTIVKPTEYIAYPEGFVRPSEYIAMPTTAPQPSAAEVKVSAAPVAATSGSSLIQIETDPVKLSTVAELTPAVYADQPAASRRRTRQREVYVENEPLVQIETQHPQA
jgi:ribonuclease E